MADQGVSSLSNVVVSIIVARSLPAEAFGAFAVSTIVYLLVAGVARAFVGEPLLSRYANVPAEVRARLLPDVAGAGLVIGVGAGLVVAATAAVAAGAAGAVMLALAPLLPLLMVQDVLRYGLIVDRPGSALVIDVAWLAAVCIALPLAPAGVGAPWYVTAWGLAAGASVLVAAIREPHIVALPHPFRWFAANWSMGWRFFGEQLSSQAVTQVVLGGVGAVGGLGVLGSVRAAQVFYGPMNTVHSGIYLALVPEGAQARGDAGRLRRLMVAASAVLVGVAVLWTVMGVLLPARVGTQLFGSSWQEGQQLMLPMGLAMVAGAVSTGAFAGLRALAAARESLRVKLRTLVPHAALPLVGTALAEGGGYAGGFALANLVAAVLYWTTFLRLVPTYEPRHLARTKMGELAPEIPPGLNVETVT